MADLCPCCRLPFWYDGVQFQEGAHCADSAALHIATRDEIACLRAGIEHRDAALAATKAKLDRALLLLVKSRDAIDLAIAETQQRPGDEEGGANG